MKWIKGQQAVKGQQVTCSRAEAETRPFNQRELCQAREEQSGAGHADLMWSDCWDSGPPGGGSVGHIGLGGALGRLRAGQTAQHPEGSGFLRGRACLLTSIGPGASLSS